MALIILSVRDNRQQEWPRIISKSRKDALNYIYDDCLDYRGKTNLDYNRLYILRIFKINGIDDGPMETHYFKIKSGIVKRYNIMSPELGWNPKLAKRYKRFIDNPSMRK